VNRRELLRRALGFSTVLAPLSFVAGKAAAIDCGTAKSFVIDFMRLLSDGKITEAYALTSLDFHRRTDVAAFDRLVRENMLDETVTYSWHVASTQIYRVLGIAHSTVKIYGTLTAKNGTQHLTTFIVKKNQNTERLDDLLIGII